MESSCDIQVDHKLLEASVKERFPFFSHNPDLVFFDNASTTQKPDTVIACMQDYYSKSCSNAGRANYRLSSKTSKEIEETRSAVARFFNTEEESIAFTSGATESLNLIALSWGQANLKDGDEIMVCLEDHKSAVFPWLNLKSNLKKAGINIEIVPYKVHDVGDYDLATIKEGLSEKTRLIAMSHIHHVYGMDMEVKDIRKIVGDQVLISLDACQSAGHIPIDLAQLPVDFLSTSGHKMFAGNGVGILWAKKEIINQLAPVKVGGTGLTIKESGATMANLFEVGTLNIPAILSLKAAIEFIEEIGIKTIESYLAKLTRYAYEGLRAIPGIDFGPGPGRCDCPGGYGIIPFRLQGIEANDLGFMLDDEDILVRTGDHCRGKQSESPEEDYVRVSMQIYNTKEDVDKLLEALEEAIS